MDRLPPARPLMRTESTTRAVSLAGIELGAFQAVYPLSQAGRGSPQEAMMDHALRTISYIADIGSIVVLMARRRMPRAASQDCIETTPGAPEGQKQYKMVCHVFESEDVSAAAARAAPALEP